MQGSFRYWVRTDGQEPREVEFHPAGPGGFRVEVGGRSYRVDARELPLGAGFSLLLDGESYDVRVEEGRGGQTAIARGERARVEVLDERRLRLRAAVVRGESQGPAQVLAPMPGKVIRVLVEPGQEVEEGRGLVVVEAMKMENELRSPRAGKVREILVKEGQTVEGGARLMVVV